MQREDLIGGATCRPEPALTLVQYSVALAPVRQPAVEDRGEHFADVCEEGDRTVRRRAGAIELRRLKQWHDLASVPLTWRVLVVQEQVEHQR